MPGRFRACEAASAMDAPNIGLPLPDGFNNCLSRGWLKPTTTCPSTVMTGTPCCPETRTISVAAWRLAATFFSTKDTPCRERNSFA
jgi:hypothetical protein